MGIARGTTPTFTLSFDDEGLDLTRARNVYATFEQGGTQITKTGEDLVIGAKTVEVYMTQEETLSFKAGSVDVQVNWTSAGGKRASSDIKAIRLTKQLLDEVIE